MALWDIKIARGKKADLPQLSLAEMGYVTDEGEIYIGGVNGENINITNNTTTTKNESDITKIKSDKTFVYSTLMATTIATEGICKLNNMNTQKWFEINNEGQLKCLVSGAYKFHGTININNAPVGRYELSCRKNVVASDYGLVNNSSIGRMSPQVTSIFRLVEDDLVDLYLNQTSGSSVTIVSDTRFSKLYIERIGD